MPYSDPEKQKKAMRKIAQDFRKRNKVKIEKTMVVIKQFIDDYLSIRERLHDTSLKYSASITAFFTAHQTALNLNLSNAEKIKQVVAMKIDGVIIPDLNILLTLNQKLKEANKNE